MVTELILEHEVLIHVRRVVEIIVGILVVHLLSDVVDLLVERLEVHEDLLQRVCWTSHGRHVVTPSYPLHCLPISQLYGL